MTRPALAGIALIATVSAASGWFLGNGWRSSPALPETAPANAPARPTSDRVRVFSDGTVSIQLSKAPLRWLLDEIARQGGALPVEASGPAVRSPTVPVAAPGECGRDDPAKSEARDSTEFVQALRGGNEAERLEALEEARSIGAELPADLLQHLIDSDPSDEVRVQAVRTYVDGRSHEADAVSALLDASRYNHSAAVRVESGKSLELLDQRQHVQAANLQP